MRLKIIPTNSRTHRIIVKATVESVLTPYPEILKNEKLLMIICLVEKQQTI